MPTGYTAKLESLDYDVNKWISETLVRAMGLCISMRDDGDLSAKQIRERLKKSEEDNYTKNQLKKMTDELNALKKLKAAEWESKYHTEKNRATKEFEKATKEHAEKSAKHREAMDRVNEMFLRAQEEGHGEGTVIYGTLKYAQEQLKSSYDYDYGTGPYRPDVLDLSLDAYKNSRLEAAKRMVRYYADDLAKKEEKLKGRNYVQEYDELLNFISGMKAKPATRKARKK